MDDSTVYIVSEGGGYARWREARLPGGTVSITHEAGVFWLTGDGNQGPLLMHDGAPPVICRNPSIHPIKPPLTGTAPAGR